MKIGLDKVISAFLSSLALLFIISTPQQAASAHTALVSSTPVAGSVLEDFPQSIVLTFNQPLLTIGGDRSNYLELISPTGESIEISESSVEQSRISASISVFPEAVGNYEIIYRVVASDGHVIRGSVDFQYQSSEIAPGDVEPVATEVREETVKFPDGLLLGLIVIAVMVAVLIYVRAGRENQS